MILMNSNFQRFVAAAATTTTIRRPVSLYTGVTHRLLSREPLTSHIERKNRRTVEPQDNACIISKYAVYSSGVMSSWSSSVTFEYDTGFPLTGEHLSTETTREECAHHI